MSISLIFSITVYNVATNELRDRLQNFQEQFEQPGIYPYTVPNPRLFSDFRRSQHEAAEHNLFIILLFVNLIILFGGGALSYALARRTLRDIERAHEEQTRFTGDASHELRTPLTAMKTELELALQGKELSKSEMRELLESNLEEVNKLTSLSQTLLALSRLGRVGLEFKSVDLGQVASEVTQKYDKNQRRIQLDLPKKPVSIKANPASIEQLLTILVDNALKYSHSKSKIHANVALEGRQAVFTITNDGKGIPSDKLPHIFERFYRADESRSAGGTGLGLALAKEIVALHKGELTVSSAVGKETTFEVTLPTPRQNQA